MQSHTAPTKYIDRLLWARENLTPVKSSKVVVWEDPAFENAPCKVTGMAPAWLACAMHGDIIPHIEAFHETEYQIEQVGGRIWKNITRLELDDLLLDFAKSGRAMKSQHVTKHNLNGETVGAMTKSEAIQFIIKRVIPSRVWSGSEGSNYQNFRVVDSSKLPNNRINRSYWKLQQDNAPIKVILPSTVDIRNTAWGLC